MFQHVLTVCVYFYVYFNVPGVLLKTLYCQMVLYVFSRSNLLTTLFESLLILLIFVCFHYRFLREKRISYRHSFNGLTYDLFLFSRLLSRHVDVFLEKYCYYYYVMKAFIYENAFSPEVCLCCLMLVLLHQLSFAQHSPETFSPSFSHQLSALRGFQKLSSRKQFLLFIQTRISVV